MCTTGATTNSGALISFGAADFFSTGLVSKSYFAGAGFSTGFGAGAAW